MKLLIKDKLWCIAFKFKALRLLFFYNLPRYSERLKSLNNLNLNRDSNVIDIGANKGIISYYILDKYNSKIFIYEPNPYCYAILKFIFRGNKKIKINQVAISNKNSKQKLFFHKLIKKNLKDVGHSESSSLELKKSNLSKKNYIYVKTLTLKNILKKICQIDFMKIDIEGHEYKIIPDILKNIKKIKIIYCEMHGKNHRKEFRKDFLYWDKKLKKIRNFNYWV